MKLNRLPISDGSYHFYKFVQPDPKILFVEREVSAKTTYTTSYLNFSFNEQDKNTIVVNLSKIVFHEKII